MNSTFSSHETEYKPLCDSKFRNLDINPLSCFNWKFPGKYLKYYFYLFEKSCNGLGAEIVLKSGLNAQFQDIKVLKHWNSS